MQNCSLNSPVCDLSYNTISISGYVALNGRMIGELWTGKDMEAILG
jgi:hypothetical protein